MENVTTLKSERKLLKQLAYYASNITLPRLVAWILCFFFSRASIFGVLRPFAPAFYAALGLTGFSKVLAIIFVALGNMAFTNFYETVRITLALLLFEALSRVFFGMGKRKESVFIRSVMIGIIMGFTGILRGMVLGLHLYDLVVSLLCGAIVFSLTVMMAPASETFQIIRKKILYDGRTLFAKAIILGIGVISLEGISIGQCELGTIAACLAVIIIARRKGSSVGACTGVLLGMVIAIYNLPSSLEIPGMMAMAGAVAGLPVKTKTTCVTLWTITVVLFSGLSILEGSLIVKYYEALAAGILFFLIPQSLINGIGDELAGIKGGVDSIDSGAKGRAEEAADKLFVLGKALSRVSRSIEDTLGEETEDMSSTSEWIIEMVAERVCNRCSFCERCWGSQILKTYRLVEKIISDYKTDDSGQIDVPGWFKSTCTKYGKFIETLGSAYSLYKAENVWRVKLNESRMMLSKQLNVISGSIMTQARALLDSTDRDYEIEGRLLGVANSRGIPISGFRYYNRQESKPYLEVIFEAKHKINTKVLDDAVRENLQTSLVRVGESRRDLMGYSVVRYMKQPRYKTATGIARTSRESGMVSGDNFAFFISSDGYHISAISDGSGSGRRAERYSRTAIQMLENLIEDGIEIGHAIRLLNLYLNLRGESERVATMDICAIDLSTGEASFYKYGASASFLKRQSETEVINMEGKESETQSVSHYKPVRIADGDLVIMISDGVLEAFSEQGEVSGLQRFIQESDTINAQNLADIILKEAIERSGDNHEDMTVLVTKLW